MSVRVSIFLVALLIILGGGILVSQYLRTSKGSEDKDRLYRVNTEEITTIKLTQKAGVDGRLFGSVTNSDIAEELVKNGYKVVKSQIRMPLGPIKTVSESTVAVALHTDVVVDVTVSVYGETA